VIVGGGRGGGGGFFFFFFLARRFKHMGDHELYLSHPSGRMDQRQSPRPAVLYEAGSPRKKLAFILHSRPE